MFIQFARLTASFALASMLCFGSVAQSAPGSDLASIQTSNQEPSQSGQSSNQTSNQNSAAQAPAQTQPASSQQTPADKTPSADAEKDKSKDPNASKDAQAPGEGKVKGTSNDRLMGVLPNFLTLENAGKLPPLSAKEKFKVVALGTFDPVQYPWWGLLAAIGQANDSEPGYGQGWASYGKRYGTTAADSIIENFMTAAVLPSILRQDPRFYQSGKGGFARRTGYAVSRIFVTPSDSGHMQFNYSEIVGSAVAAAISTYSYHPRSTYLSTPTNPHMFVGSDRTLENTASVWGTQVGIDTITIVIKEFWPDIHRKIAHRNAHKEPVVLGPTVTDPAKQ